MPVPYKLCHIIGCPVAIGEGNNCNPGSCKPYQKAMMDLTRSQGGLYTYNTADFSIRCDVCHEEAGGHLDFCPFGKGAQ